MKYSFGEDQWLGSIHSFPTILHARASLSFDIHPASLQKILVSALSSLRESPVSTKISVADVDGYSNGRAHFAVGIGNGDGFDILDTKERERVLNRIENQGAFDFLDLAVHVQYRVDDGRMHKVHQDQYMIRLVFEPGRIEAMIHHQKGIRRVDPRDLLELLVQHLNVELARERFPSVSLESITST